MVLNASVGIKKAKSFAFEKQIMVKNDIAPFESLPGRKCMQNKMISDVIVILKWTRMLWLTQILTDEWTENHSYTVQVKQGQ